MVSNTKNDMANIRHISGTLHSDDLYALPNKHRNNTANVYEVPSDEEDRDELGKHNEISIEEKDLNSDLPYGWEKHEDNDGPYYWHIKSGTIQREPPLWPKNQQNDNGVPKTPIAQAPSFITHIINKNSHASSQQQQHQQHHDANNEIVKQAHVSSEQSCVQIDLPLMEFSFSLPSMK